MPVLPESFVAAAQAGADLAGAAIRPLFRSALLVEAKGDASPVTEADRRAELVLQMAGDRLVLLHRPRLHAIRLVPAPPMTETELLRGVQGVEASYWPHGTTPRWLPSWNQAALPALVRLRIVFPPGDRRRWPDMVVAPMRLGAAG